MGELVGRALELRRLTEAIARAAEGHSGAVLVAGEPGIGKTRLAREAVAAAQARGFLILEARAYPVETGLAYGPIVDAFGTYLRELRPTRRAVLAGDLSALGRLFDDLDLGPYEPVGDPAVDKMRLFEAVARLAERLADEQPLLLLMDDVHCADPSSLELLHYLARGLRGRRALLLATARDDADSLRPLRPLLASLRREGGLDEIRPARLDASTMATFVRHLLDGDPPPTLLELLERRAVGVPLFAEALVQALLETGQLSRDPRGWSLRRSSGAELPPRVTDLILERVERLQSLERRVLELVAVGGETVPHALLAAAAGLDVEALGAATAELRATGLLDEVVDGASIGYRARHPFIQEVVYADLGELPRRQAHARFAAALERDRAADVERLPRHYRGAGPEADPPRAIEVLLAAGARALELSACDEAVAHLSAAVGLLKLRGDHDRLSGALESLGLAWDFSWWTGRLAGVLAAGTGFRAWAARFLDRLHVPDEIPQRPAQPAGSGPLLRPDGQWPLRERSAGADPGTRRGIRPGHPAQHRTLCRSAHAEGTAVVSPCAEPGPDAPGHGRLSRTHLHRSHTQREHVWQRHDAPPSEVRQMSRPTTFVPGERIRLPRDVQRWLPRYTRPPVLAYVNSDGWPAAVRVEATLRPDYIEITSDVAPLEGAPASLTYHRLIGNYRANDAFLCRGHFDAAGRLIPEKLVGYGGTSDDRGVGSLKVLGVVRDLGKQLPAKLASEGRPSVIPRPTPR